MLVDFNLFFRGRLHIISLARQVLLLTLVLLLCLLLLGRLWHVFLHLRVINFVITLCTRDDNQHGSQSDLLLRSLTLQDFPDLRDLEKRLPLW